MLSHDAVEALIYVSFVQNLSSHVPCDTPRPIRGQYPGHVIIPDQSEAGIQVTQLLLINQRPPDTDLNKQWNETLWMKPINCQAFHQTTVQFLFRRGWWKGCILWILVGNSNLSGASHLQWSEIITPPGFSPALALNYHNTFPESGGIIKLYDFIDTTLWWTWCKYITFRLLEKTHTVMVPNTKFESTKYKVSE